jgi:hypothetical protein
MQSRVLYTGDASTRLYAVPFPYLSKAHVKVFLNKFPLNTPLDYSWNGDGSIEFRVAPQQDDAIEIARFTTENDALVRFQNGSVLTEDELNTAVLQMLYLLQETRDAYADSLGSGMRRIAGNTGILGATAEDIINNAVQAVLNDELTAYLQQRISDITLNSEELIEQRIRLDTIQLLVNALAEIDGVALATFIINEQTQRIEGDEALAQTISLIGAKSGDSLSFILDLDKVFVSPAESMATRLEVIRSSIADNSALIASESTTRVTALEALATQFNAQLVKMGEDVEAMIVSESLTRATAEEALARRMDGMQAEVDGNRATILTESTTRATADSALAEQYSTLQTSVNGNTASIQTHAQTIDGLKAQYSVKLDVNGYITGFGLYNDGTSGQFTILADRFALVTPGAAPVVPFVADANGVYMDTAYIRNLVVDRITGGNISAQWNISNSSGRIVLDTGAYMKVIGVGFGANSDLIEWFGPKMAISACTKANAKTYVGMDGSAYFGGSLSAGTLYNAAETTSSGFPVSAVVGPFTTNGNTKTVVVSYTYAHANAFNSESIGNGNGGTVTVKLFRRLGVGSEVLLGTYSVQLSRFSEQDGANWQVSENGSGSWTYTDNTPGTDDRTFRVEVTSRTGTANIPTIPTQRAGAVITEE